MLIEKPQAFDAILKFYTEQFKYSASQRISTIQYFVAAFAFLTGGYTTLVTAKAEPPMYARFVVAFAAYLLTLAFARLDRRNKQIVELDEKPLIRLQTAIARALNEDDRRWHSFELRDGRAEHFTTYGSLVPFIYSIATIAAALGAGSGLQSCLSEVTTTFVLIGFGLVCIFMRFPPKRT
jgi:hypothetical protein